MPHAAAGTQMLQNIIANYMNSSMQQQGKAIPNFPFQLDNSQLMQKLTKDQYERKPEQIIPSPPLTSSNSE